MIGLTIRTLVIIMMLAAAPPAAVRYAVMVCTAVTTICGVWLAYGEPPNLIMKANLYPQLGNAFFLVYCAPAAIAAYSSSRGSCAAGCAGQRVDLEEHGRHRRQRRRRAVPPGRAPRRGADAGRARRGACGAGGRLGRARDRPDPWRRAARHRADPRRCAGGHAHGSSSATSSPRNSPTASIATTCSTSPASYEAAFQAEQAVDEVLAAMARLRRRAQRIGGTRADAVRRVARRPRHLPRGPAVSRLVCRVSRRPPGDRAASPRCARSPCGKPGSSTPSITFCFRCSCRSRC